MTLNLSFQYGEAVITIENVQSIKVQSQASEAYALLVTYAAIRNAEYWLRDMSDIRLTVHTT